MLKEVRGFCRLERRRTFNSQRSNLNVERKANASFERPKSNIEVRRVWRCLWYIKQHRLRKVRDGRIASSRIIAVAG